MTNVFRFLRTSGLIFAWMFFFIVRKILSVLSTWNFLCIQLHLSVDLVLFLCYEALFHLRLWKKEKNIFSLLLNCRIRNKVRNCLPSTGERYKFANFVVNQFSRLSVLKSRRDIFSKLSVWLYCHK